ncbi:MAG: hypothetical protein GXX83_00530 [Gaiellales bacterium]|nr:hypothetical protein [Gaiellales bacterium]
MARLGDLLALSYNGLVQSWPEIVQQVIVHQTYARLAFGHTTCQTDSAW